MNFIENMKQRARNEIKKIVLPEASDLRTIKAAAIALEEKYAEIVLIGDEVSINKLAEERKQTIIDFILGNVTEVDLTLPDVVKGKVMKKKKLN